MDEAGVNGPTLLFTCSAIVVVGVLVRLLPALRATRNTAADPQRASSALSVTERYAGRLHSWLVGLEVGTSAVCLEAGAFLVISFVRLLTVERGFDAANVVAIDFALPPRYDEAVGAQFANRLVSFKEVRRAGWVLCTSWNLTPRLPAISVNTSPTFEKE